ncbi:MFS transporter [Qingrenia yutianensis]|uniref:MFS transporter n=1 Tax=Qingrenia yutianensis TaxID=2763676 RepID=A0A926FD54_9FIRM|nr:MFS transporter [Qingrenia yutianensis]MBC8596542.1 MFS transporter [Qingrenia yutianensis]
MEKITDKKQVLSASLLFMFLYLISYVTRINYGAVISEICAAENMQKSLVSLALTMSAVTYGTGQLISGFLGDRLNPKRLIFGGLLLTAATNLIIPVCTSPYQMAAVWAVNGFAQAFMWPPLVKIMATLFTSEDYKKACVIVTWGSSFGTIAVYALSPVCISLFGWRGVFVVSAFFAVLMSVIWMKKCRFENGSTHFVTNKITETNEKFGVKYLVLMGLIMLAIVLQGILRDGVTTWMPSYISETFNLDRRAAILTGVILPVFSIGAIQLTSVIYRKFIKSELMLASVVFFAGFISALLLFSVNGKSAPFSILFSAVLTACMYGVNIVMTCMVPPYFAKYGNISFMSGLLNFCTYIGSAASGAGLALFSEKFGWSATIVLWAVIALAGGLICLAVTKPWNKFKEN